MRRRGRAPAARARVFGTEGHPAVGDHAERNRDLVSLQVLAEESCDADFPCLRQQRRIGQAGQHQDLCLRITLPYRPGRVETAAVGQTQIQQAGIGPVRGHGRDAIAGTRRDGQYLMTAGLKDRRESLA